MKQKTRKKMGGGGTPNFMSRTPSAQERRLFELSQIHKAPQTFATGEATPLYGTQDPVFMALNLGFQGLGALKGAATKETDMSLYNKVKAFEPHPNVLPQRMTPINKIQQATKAIPETTQDDIWNSFKVHSIKPTTANMQPWLDGIKGRLDELEGIQKKGGRVRKKLKMVDTPTASPIQTPDNMYNFGGTLGSILSTTSPLANLIPGVGFVAAPLIHMAGDQLQRDNQPPQQRYGNGGMNNMIDINVEGSNQSEGAAVNMRKGELLVKDGKIHKNYIAIPPHPTIGMNPEGNVSEEEGMIIIPKNRTKEYMNTDKKSRRMIEKSLVSQQDWRANKALDTLKKGGLISGGIYAMGGAIQFDPNQETLDAETFNKFGKGGYISGQSYDVSDEELQSLKQQGYKIQIH